jgi:hypothetical protein
MDVAKAITKSRGVMAVEIEVGTYQFPDVTRVTR